MAPTLSVARRLHLARLHRICVRLLDSNAGPVGYWMRGSQRRIHLDCAWKYLCSVRDDRQHAKSLPPPEGVTLQAVALLDRAVALSRSGRACPECQGLCGGAAPDCEPCLNTGSGEVYWFRGPKAVQS